MVESTYIYTVSTFYRKIDYKSFGDELFEKKSLQQIFQVN